MNGEKFMLLLFLQLKICVVWHGKRIKEMVYQDNLITQG